MPRRSAMEHMISNVPSMDRSQMMYWRRSPRRPPWGRGTATMNCRDALWKFDFSHHASALWQQNHNGQGGTNGRYATTSRCPWGGERQYERWGTWHFILMGRSVRHDAASVPFHPPPARSSAMGNHPVTAHSPGNRQATPIAAGSGPYSVKVDLPAMLAWPPLCW